MAENKICPKCKTDNPVGASFCRHCRYEFPEATKKGTKLSPEILSFTVEEHAYTMGSCIHFLWKVENANIIQINDVDVTSLDKYEFKVNKAETITLVAENDYDKATRCIRLSPKPVPSIQSFSSSSQHVKAGQDIKLKWDVRNASKIILSLSDGDYDVSWKNYIKVVPAKTEIYTLTCYAEDENIYTEQSLVVTVIETVRINSFTASEEVIIESDKVVLKWDVENATSIMILPMMKDVTKQKSYQVSPARTTEYVLEAQNSISREEMSLSVGVRQLPKIDMKFADSFSKIELPTCEINFSFLSDSMKKARIDEWMTTAPTKDIDCVMWKIALKNKWKAFISKIGLTK